MRILITGGSGFLGRALTKAWRDEHTVCVYSRGEAAQSQLDEHPNVRRFIGDVRDLQRLRRAMEGCDVVIHAAALKRIEVGQYNPDEMVKTNVIGTMNVIEAAKDCRVKRVVYTSTDKAWQPISPYGCSKAIAEQLVIAANNTVRSTPVFVVTRYGNVMGSTGSVVPIWRKLKSEGKRGKITDPNATRFWMHIDEAVSVVESAMWGDDRLVIPTLSAFRLSTLAKAIGIECDVIGLPEWEKTHEGLRDGQSSEFAHHMSVNEIREALTRI